MHGILLKGVSGHIFLNKNTSGCYELKKSQESLTCINMYPDQPGVREVFELQ